MSHTTAATWGERATVAQRSLDHFFGTAAPQLYNNIHPLREPSDNETFNYWWLAHLIDARLDGYERTGENSYLDSAITVFDNIVERNEGSLFNDYFDDMLWLALASLRLSELSGHDRYADAATAIWEHCIQEGWNEQHGPSLAWRKPQLYYKNTPANGPLSILSMRLFRRTDEERYARYGRAAHAWIEAVMRDAETGFVEDGINREQDGRIDTQWRFTYNQGLYIGSAVEHYLTDANPAHLERAWQTVGATLTELGSTGVLLDEGDGGDEGLFRGVFFRYARLLLATSPSPSRDLVPFVLGACETLWETCASGDVLLANNDWRQAPTDRVYYSTQLSAIMGLELAAQIAGY